MGFLDRLTAMRDIPVAWHELTSEAQLDDIIKESKSRTVAIFKHSTRCGTSHHIKSNLENNWDFEDKDLKLYYLDLLAYRSVSNLIAERFGIIHQSPQVIVLKNGKPSFDTSHHGISVERLRGAL